jgi:hypothetical protein
MPTTDLPAPTQATRFFVITVGRSGSSLLCAVLADAGADFGMAPPTDWNPDAGVMEHPLIVAAARDYRRAHDALHGSYWVSPELESRWRRWRGRMRLRRALTAARYVKIGDLDLCVQPAAKLGYEPRVILSYRRFLPSVSSILVGRTHAAPDAIARDYVRSYRQGLTLLHTYGGCAIGYEDLTGGAAPQVLEALARVTGIGGEALTAAHARRARVRESAEVTTGAHAEAAAVYAELQRWRGTVFAPAARAARVRARWRGAQ